MKVVIHNEHLLAGKDQTGQIVEAIKDQYKWLEKINKSLDNDSLHAFLVEKDGGMKATIYLKHNNHQVFAEAQGQDPVDLVDHLMTKLRSQMLRQMIEANKKSRIIIAKNHLAKLNELNKEGEKEHFVFLVKQLLPSIRGFVSRYLHGRHLKMPAGFKMNDLMDEIYLALYERFNECPINEDEFSAWCFQIAQETVEDFIERNHTPEGTISIDEITKKDLKEMEEKYTMDADGDLVMLEEIDDTPTLKGVYGNEILNDEALVELPKEVEIDPIVKGVLQKVKPQDRLAFQLFWLHEMTAKEIAKALRLQIEEVENTIDEITEQIVLKLNENGTV